MVIISALIKYKNLQSEILNFNWIDFFLLQVCSVLNRPYIV